MQSKLKFLLFTCHLFLLEIVQGLLLIFFFFVSPTFKAQCVDCFLLALSQDENEMGRFLREQGAQDKSKAGKMMIAVGKAQSYSAQQRSS